MLLGIILLKAIAEVTLLSGLGPFRAMVDRLNPVLGWAFILAVLAANVVWCMPQFVLGVSVLEHVLFPTTAGLLAKAIYSVLMLAAAVLAILLYRKGQRGVRWFEGLLRVLVGVIVLCFVGVVVSLRHRLPWHQIWNGFVPSLDLWFQPSEIYDQHIQASGSAASFWTERILRDQRQVMIAAAATAVGINMTFLLPYSLLRKGWNRNFRGLVTFDLVGALLIPFVIASSCVVIAASASFHGKPVSQLLSASNIPESNDGRAYGELLIARGQSSGENSVQVMAQRKDVQRLHQSLPLADRTLAAMLVKRSTVDLSMALEPFAGREVSRIVFGVGVFAMALSTAMILMLISGFAVREVVRGAPNGRAQLIGSLLPGVGVLGPFIWSGAAFWLAVPTSVFGMVLLPIAAFSFLLMMNSRRILGDSRPRGSKRLFWNLALGGTACLLTPASLYSAWVQGGWLAIACAGMLVLAAVLVHFRWKPNP
jgi:hypothetical protein